MSRIPRISGKEILQILLREGFSLSHIRGSHHYLRKAGNSSLVVIPVHGNQILPHGTFRSILHQANITLTEFLNMIN